MPSARSATAAARRRDRPPARRPQRVAARGPRVRIRWERVGRVGLLVVLAVVIGLYVEHTLAYVSTRIQSDRQSAIVEQLTRQNAALARQQRELDDPATIVRDARGLGMIRPGEQPYVVAGSGTGN